MQIMGLLLFFVSSLRLLKFRFQSAYFRILFYTFAGWSLIVVIRGLTFNLNFLRTILLDNDFGVLLYLVPFITLFEFNKDFFIKLFDVILIFGILSIIFEVLLLSSLLTRSRETQNIIENISPYFSIASGFILMTFKYHSRPKRILALTVVILSLIFSIYQGRRGLTSIISGVLILSYVLYLKETNSKILAIYLSVLILSISLFYLSNLYQIQNNQLLSHIAYRGDEDTRTGVELYFYDDMEETDWIFGKGMSGLYYCPGIGDGFGDYRQIIETGYLQIILKGGLIRLLLYLLISLPAIFLGFFHSTNLLGKASACWILISLGSLYPSTVEFFSPSYLLTWISIGICYSSELRYLSDPQIKSLLTSKSNNYK